MELNRDYIDQFLDVIEDTLDSNHIYRFEWDSGEKDKHHAFFSILIPYDELSPETFKNSEDPDYSYMLWLDNLVYSSNGLLKEINKVAKIFSYEFWLANDEYTEIDAGTWINFDVTKRDD